MQEQQPRFIKLVSEDGRCRLLAPQSEEEIEGIMKKEGFTRYIEIGASEYFTHFAIVTHGFFECFERYEAFNSARTNGLLQEIAILKGELALIRTPGKDNCDAC